MELGSEDEEEHLGGLSSPHHDGCSLTAQAYLFSDILLNSKRMTFTIPTKVYLKQPPVRSFELVRLSLRASALRTQ